MHALHARGRGVRIGLDTATLLAKSGTVLRHICAALLVLSDLYLLGRLI